MMKKNKFSHKVIAVYLTLNFLQSFIPHHMLWASNNGPNAPEAAAFEPVDATDMVNLLTGDFTYVLPLLNVPSPEGGYPLALSYHAGIAMDQEASWVGLGWNLNPGAINRSINGFPDDYNGSTLSEFFYDEGGSETFYALSVGYGSPEGAFSVGLGFSWGGNRGLVGSVSLSVGIAGAGGDHVGVGFKASSDGNLSINAGYTSASGLTFGASAGTDGVGASVGFNNNGEGFSVGAHSSGAINVSLSKGLQNNKSLGLNFTVTSNGVGISSSITNNDNNGKGIKGVGIGMNVAFANSTNSGDYVVKQSGWTIPIMIPTHIGTFYASFGKQKITWYLNKRENNIVTGPLFFHEGANSATLCQYYNDDEHHPRYFYAPCGTIYSEPITSTGETKVVSEAFMDIYEFPITADENFQKIHLDVNNATFPSYDNYTVDAQGISGSIAPNLLENGILFGLGKDLEDKNIIYTIDGEGQPINAQLKFNNKPEFYFANAFSTYTEVAPTTLNTNYNTSILEYSNYTNDEFALPRRKTSNFIAYFTNDEILNHDVETKQKGFLKPSNTDIDRAAYPESGIGAFKVTGSDGKTYHYSLPVYNHEVITRTHGAINNKPERDSYFEKRQLEPYATHWLLTAVTGPDYVDKNANGYADAEDYGYWVVFDYGLWSNAYAWKAPYGEDHIVSEENSNIKTRYTGRKQIYYLNKVRTRTHTALFIKSLREDSRSHPWTYTSVEWQGQQNSGDFDPRFTIPAQFPLRLDQIILKKNVYAGANPPGGYLSQHNGTSVDIHYPGGKNTTAYYHLEDNALGLNGASQHAHEHAIKVINFHYKNPTESLAKGTPNTANPNHGRLTLHKVSFAGKEGVSVIPPYVFEYHNPQYRFNIADKDNWGYHKAAPETGSLSKITTPQGGAIEIAYEGHSIQSAVKTGVLFKNTHIGGYSIISNGNSIYTINSKDNFEMQVGDTLEFDYKRSCWANVGQGEGSTPIDCNYSETATVIQNLGNNTFKIDVGSNGCEINYNCIENISEKYEALYTVIRPIPNAAGIRVSHITTTDGTNRYTTRYTYGENGDGIGYVSYLPFAPELDKEVPYSSELPAPKPMYEYVRVENTDALGNSYGSTQYHFNVMKEKDEETIRFGDFFSITLDEENRYNGVKDKDVNIKEIMVQDNLSAIGQLLDIQVFNQAGQLLRKTINSYFGQNDRPDHQGIFQESYQTYKEVDYTNEIHNDKWLINTSTRRTYANALKNTTTISGGFSQTTYFDVYDEYTGATTETTTYASDGTAFKTKTVPAYTRYPEMGSKVDHPTHKNMLSQQAAGYTYFKDSETGAWKTTGVGITTWNDEWSYRDFLGVEHQPEEDTEKIWRKHQTYIWEGERNSDGSLQNFSDNFDWSPGAVQASVWKKTTETTRYDVYSMPLEIMDLNGNKVSTKKNRYADKIIATANAGYDEMFYSGAEDASIGDRRFGGDVYRGDHAEVGPNAHTGNYAVQADTHERAFAVVPQQTGDYRISVWVNQEDHTATRVVSPSGTFVYHEGEIVSAGNWVQLNFTLPVTAGEEVYVTTLAASARFDDFRMHPIASSMTAYVYNEWDELSYMLGANNLATHFEYDTNGRLINTYVEVADFDGLGTGGFKHSKAYQYRYALTETIDTDDDEVIDPEELYDPLGATFHAQYGYSNSGILEVNAIGGSGEYAYRFGSGVALTSGGNISDQIDAISYGPVTTNNTYHVGSVPCSGHGFGYQVRAVKIEVRDQVTGEVRTYQKNYNKSCPEDEDQNGQDEHGNHH